MLLWSALILVTNAKQPAYCQTVIRLDFERAEIQEYFAGGIQIGVQPTNTFRCDPGEFSWSVDGVPFTPGFQSFRLLWDEQRDKFTFSAWSIRDAIPSDPGDPFRQFQYDFNSSARLIQPGDIRTYYSFFSPLGELPVDPPGGSWQFGEWKHAHVELVRSYETVEGPVYDGTVLLSEVEISPPSVTFPHIENAGYATDCDCDGDVDVEDIFAFLTLWFSDPEAEVSEVFEYLERWFA